VDRNKAQRGFVGCQIPVRGGIEITEAIEFERDGEAIMRISAIRESIEFMTWEVVGNAQGSNYFRSMNSVSNTTFRYPFYAYINGAKEIKIYNLDKPYLGVKYLLDGKEDESYNKIAFSNLGNLFVQATNQTEVIYYRLNCVEDLSTDSIRKDEIEEKEKAKLLLAKMNSSTHKFAPALAKSTTVQAALITGTESDDEEREYAQEFARFPKRDRSTY
jgi:hypothetical protein